MLAVCRSDPRVRACCPRVAPAWALFGAVACAAAIATPSALAGSTLDATIDRHRALRDAAPARAAAADASGGAGLWFLAGGPDAQAPRLLAPELDRHGGGLRWAHTWRFDSPAAAAPVHLGAGAAAAAPLLRLSLTLPFDTGPPRRSALSWLEHSEAVLPLPLGELFAGVLARHWGPGWTAGLLLDGGAAPLPSFGWRADGIRPDVTWLSWLGPWSAEVFAGRLEGHESPARPWLIGMRLAIAPVPGLELGAARVLQWGGRGRPENARTLLGGLIGRDNLPGSDEPGNQLGGFDLRWTAPLAGGRTGADDGPRTVSVYAQAVGEDEAGRMPSTWFGLGGIDATLSAGGVLWRPFLELADTLAGRMTGDPRPAVAYRHHLYRQGYTHAGRPLGHPAGGDVRLASLGLIADGGPRRGMLILHAGRAGAAAQRFPSHARLTGFDLAASFDLPGARARAGASWSVWNVTGEPRRRTLQAWWLWRL